MVGLVPIQIADALPVLSHSDMQISAPTLAEPVSAQRVDITLSETMFGWNEVEQGEFAYKRFNQRGIKVIWSDNQRVGVVGWEQYQDHIWLKKLFVLP